MLRRKPEAKPHPFFSKTVFETLQKVTFCILAPRLSLKCLDCFQSTCSALLGCASHTSSQGQPDQDVLKCLLLGSLPLAPVLRLGHSLVPKWTQELRRLHSRDTTLVCLAWIWLQTLLKVYLCILYYIFIYKIHVIFNTLNEKIIWGFVDTFNSYNHSNIMFPLLLFSFGCCRIVSLL